MYRQVHGMQSGTPTRQAMQPDQANIGMQRSRAQPHGMAATVVTVKWGERGRSRTAPAMGGRSGANQVAWPLKPAAASLTVQTRARRDKAAVGRLSGEAENQQEDRACMTPACAWRRVWIMNRAGRQRGWPGCTSRHGHSGPPPAATWRLVACRSAAHGCILRRN